MIDNSILGSQKTFRLLLQAMSHPGTVYHSVNRQDRKGNDMTGLMDICETLLDREVGFAVINDDGSLTKEISRRTRSRTVSIPDADFIIVVGGTSNRKILEGKRGSLEYPDNSATAIYVIPSCREGNSGNSILLKGPGIETETFLELQGFQRDELKAIQHANSEYPLGLDVIFVDRNGHISCIPRSITIAEIY